MLILISWAKAQQKKKRVYVASLSCDYFLNYFTNTGYITISSPKSGCENHPEHVCYNTVVSR